MLTKNSLLEEIIAQLEKKKIPDELLIEEFRRKRKRVTQEESLHGILGEIHMQLALQEICKTYGKLVEHEPIPSGTSTESYRFRRNTYGNLAVFRRYNGQQHGEFDELLLIDGLPVVFESKLHRTSEKSIASLYPSSHFASKHSLGRYEAMFHQKIEHQLGPLRQYFHQQACGYVVIIYPSQRNSPHPVQQEFLRNGGMLASFPLDWKEHKKETREIFEKISA